MKKRGKQARDLKSIALWGAFLGVFIAELLFYTWCRVQSTQISYDISRARKTHREYLTMQNNLKIEIARLKSPERLQMIAQNKLGLSMPTPKQVILLP